MNIITTETDCVREIMDIQDKLSKISWVLHQPLKVLQSLDQLLGDTTTTTTAITNIAGRLESLTQRIENLKERAASVERSVGFTSSLPGYHRSWPVYLLYLTYPTNLKLQLRKVLDIQLSISGLPAAEEIRKIAAAISGFTGSLVTLSLATNMLLDSSAKFSAIMARTLKQSKQTQEDMKIILAQADKRAREAESQSNLLFVFTAVTVFFVRVR